MTIHQNAHDVLFTSSERPRGPGRVDDRRVTSRGRRLGRRLLVPLAAVAVTVGCGSPGDTSGVNDYLTAIRPADDVTFVPLPSAGTRAYLEALIDPTSVAITGEDFSGVSTDDQISVGFVVCSYLDAGYSVLDVTSETAESGVNAQVSYLIASTAATHLCPEHAGLFPG